MAMGIFFDKEICFPPQGLVLSPLPGISAFSQHNHNLHLLYSFNVKAALRDEHILLTWKPPVKV